MSAILSGLTLFPFKSLDGVAVSSFEIGEGSYVVGDRRYALFNAAGKYINGKAEPLVHALRLKQTGEGYTIYSQKLNRSCFFDSSTDCAGTEAFFSDHFEYPVLIKEDKQGNFQDVPHDAAITLVSTASLIKAGEWMGINDLHEIRRRFRATVEIDGVEAFWEDALFGKPGEEVSFRIGEVTFVSVGPRERCVVPTRHPDSGIVFSGFAKQFATARWSEVPERSELHAWGHGYFLSVDCKVLPSSFGKRIKVGDNLIV